MSVRLMHGDTVEQMRTLPSESFDACVTDPPAGITFMGRSWDHDKGGRRQWVAWMTEVFTEVYRVMKPGAHGLVWALPRTSHWTAWALEDAGFECRDAIVHLFGSGFPKGHDISKAIDRMAGAERQVVGTKLGLPGYGVRNGLSNYPQLNDDGWSGVGAEHGGTAVTAPATDAAREWQGWNTALKPAAEIWWLIRKPLSEKTVAANVLRWGTGGLNIDAARITAQAGDYDHPGNTLGHRDDETSWRIQKRKVEPHDAGRWPANVVLSHEPECQEVGTRRVKTGVAVGRNIAGTEKNRHGIYGPGLPHPGTDATYADADGLETVPAFQCVESCAVRILDEQAGELGNAYRPNRVVGQQVTESDLYGKGLGKQLGRTYEGTGGPSRFFYTAKASPRERNAGMPEGESNRHPTVKPLSLISWLVKLVSPPGGTVLDPFMGSGTTGCAVAQLGMDFVGIDNDPESVATAERRIAYWGSVVGVTASARPSYDRVGKGQVDSPAGWLQLPFEIPERAAHD